MLTDRFSAVAVVAAVLLTAGCQKPRPDVPSVPSGLASGGIVAAYVYSSSATDPNGDSVAIRFEWGDGDTSEWSGYMPSGETASASHAWTDTGTYQVRAQAKNLKNATSDWSSSLQVTVGFIWYKTYGGTINDYGQSVQQTTDGGYIVAGVTETYGAGSGDLYMVRLNPAGDTLWTRAFGGYEKDAGSSVIQTADGGFAVFGYSNSVVDQQMWLVKTDTNGNRLWDRMFGYNDYGENGQSIQHTANGGYILAGATTQYDDDGDVWLLKLGADGETGWYKHSGGGDMDERFSVRQTPDGGFIVTGVKKSGAGDYDLYLFKTDGVGNLVWEKTFGGAANDRGYSVQLTSDSGYIVAGYTGKLGAGENDVYLIKTDASGSELWTRTFGGTSSEEGRSVRATADGGYVVAGWTESFGAGGRDVFVIKTDANGNAE